MSDSSKDESTENTEATGLEEDGPGGVWPPDRLKPVLEALLFGSGEPLPVRRVCEIVEGASVADVRATLKELATDLLTRGIRLVEVAGGWQLRTAPEHHQFVKRLFKERSFRLTRAAVETMSIIAYKQPATRADVEEVRGVDCGGVLETLVERRLLKILGRMDVAGRPLVYGTTREFLELFGLKSLRDLPTLAELGDDITRMADQSGFSEGPEGEAEILPLDGGSEENSEPESEDAQNDPGPEDGAEEGADLEGEQGPEPEGDQDPEPEGDEGTDAQDDEEPEPEGDQEPDAQDDEGAGEEDTDEER